MRRTTALLLGIAATLAGCGSYRDDIDNMCNAAERSAVPPDAPDRATRIAAWVQKTVRTSDGQKLVASLGAFDNAHRKKILDDEAARVGLTGCPLVDDAK